MIGRIFWFLIGAGVAIFLAKKIRDYLKQATPQAIGHRVADQASGVGESVRDFAATVRAAMAERETELRDALGLTES